MCCWTMRSIRRTPRPCCLLKASAIEWLNWWCERQEKPAAASDSTAQPRTQAHRWCAARRSAPGWFTVSAGTKVNHVPGLRARSPIGVLHRGQRPA